MDGPIVSALLILFIMYGLIFMRGMEEGYSEAEAAVTEYKVRVMLMLAKTGQGKPLDITKMSADKLNAFFKDFLMIFNEFQAKTNGKPVTMAEVQATFPIDFLNEYNLNIEK
jgi:hypothetical protein